jgi:hypothetical protein
MIRSKIVALALGAAFLVGCAQHGDDSSDRKAARAREWLELIVGKSAVADARKQGQPILLKRWTNELRYYVVPESPASPQEGLDRISASAERFVRKISDSAVADLPAITHVDTLEQANLLIVVGDVDDRQVAELEQWKGFAELAQSMKQATRGVFPLSSGSCFREKLTVENTTTRGLVEIHDTTTQDAIDHCIATAMLDMLGIEGLTDRSPSVTNAAHPSQAPEFVDRDALRILYGDDAKPGTDLDARIQAYLAKAILPSP